MKRRDFIKSLAALPFVGSVIAWLAPKPALGVPDKDVVEIDERHLNKIHCVKINKDEMVFERIVERLKTLLALIEKPRIIYVSTDIWEILERKLGSHDFYGIQHYIFSGLGSYSNIPVLLKGEQTSNTITVLQ